MKTTISTDRIVRESECKFITGVSRVSRWRWEQEGKFPKRRKLSANCVGWLLSKVMEWINATGKAVA